MPELGYGLRHEVLSRKVARNNSAVLRKAPVPFISVLFQSRPFLVRFRRLLSFLLLFSIFLNIIVFWLGEFDNFGRLSLSDLGLRRLDFVCFFWLALRLFLGFVSVCNTLSRGACVRIKACEARSRYGM